VAQTGQLSLGGLPGRLSPQCAHLEFRGHSRQSLVLDAENAKQEALVHPEARREAAEGGDNEQFLHGYCGGG
jgi:hypothetical protein